MSSGLRWIILEPTALIAGYLAYLVGGFINRLSITLFMGPPEGWIQLAAIYMEQLYMGAVIPYVAGYIAPSHKVDAALGFSALVMVIAGISLGIWLTHDSANTLADQVASISGLIGGSASISFAAYRNRIDFGENAA